MLQIEKTVERYKLRMLEDRSLSDEEPFLLRNVTRLTDNLASMEAVITGSRN